jgi:60 kDa SS-A/Ro ribonucleoprotein
MSNNALKTVNYRNPATPQTEKAVKGQKKNAAGGYTFVLTDFERAKRFVILGSSDSYYTPGATLAKENATAIRKVIDGGQSRELVDYVVDVSTNGRAAKQQPGLFALALASSFGTTEEKQYALSKLPEVARTGTTLFEFVTFALQFRSWGRALKNAVAKWYTEKDVDKLAYQMVKYQNREGWSHGDILRVTHPKGSEYFDALAKWSLNKNLSATEETLLPSVVHGYEVAKTVEGKDLTRAIGEYGLTWEMIPNDKRTEDVWKTLVTSMPLGALLRQLPTLTRKNVLTPLSNELRSVTARFADAENVKRARLHPIQILLALKTYESGGRYSRGSNTWTPVQQVVAALEKAFYLSFDNVEPMGKRILLGVDVSPSMGTSINDSALTSYEAVGALAMQFVKTEPQTHAVAFASEARSPYGYGRGHGVMPLNINAGQSLSQVLNTMQGFRSTWAGTDCALPMLHALENKIPVDVFFVLTDNDTWAGSIHPHEALNRYRREMGIDAKLVVLSTYASRNTIADPNDDKSLDIAGFDTSVPSVIKTFVEGF